MLQPPADDPVHPTDVERDGLAATDVAIGRHRDVRLKRRVRAEMRAQGAAVETIVERCDGVGALVRHEEDMPASAGDIEHGQGAADDERDGGGRAGDGGHLQGDVARRRVHGKDQGEVSGDAVGSRIVTDADRLDPTAVGLVDRGVRHDGQRGDPARAADVIPLSRTSPARHALEPDGPR